MAVGAIFAMYRVCSLYNWIANILSNIRVHPQQSPLVGDAAHPSKLTLPTFWISEPVAWFALAEAKFQTSNITNQRVMFDLLVAALLEKNLSEVMDIIPAINPFEVLKQQVAAVQPKKKQFKKKTGGGGGSSGGRVSSGNGGILSHAEQTRVGFGLCFKHFCSGARATSCTKNQLCNWSGN
jgi:hypothetical protein